MTPTNSDTLPDDGGWRPIETLPPEGTAVLLYFAALERFDIHGKPSTMGPLRDHVERFETGWFEDGQWWESGTGHDVFEDWRAPEQLPTHWMPLPAPPTKDKPQ